MRASEKSQSRVSLLSACSDAVVVAASRSTLPWPPASGPLSPLCPTSPPDGTVSEPVSGRFSVICHPEEGGEGIQRAILAGGVYHVTRTLRIDRSVHIFGVGVGRRS